MYFIEEIRLSQRTKLAFEGYIPLGLNIATKHDQSKYIPPMNINCGIGGPNVSIYLKYKELKKAKLNDRVLVGINIGDWGGDWDIPRELLGAKWETPISERGIPPGALTPGTKEECDIIGMAVKFKTVRELRNNTSSKYVNSLKLSVIKKNDKRALENKICDGWESNSGNALDIHSGCGDNKAFRLFLKKDSFVLNECQINS